MSAGKAGRLQTAFVSPWPTVPTVRVALQMLQSIICHHFCCRATLQRMTPSTEKRQKFNKIHDRCQSACRQFHLVSIRLSDGCHCCAEAIAKRGTDGSAPLPQWRVGDNAPYQTVSCCKSPMRASSYACRKSERLAQRLGRKFGVRIRDGREQRHVVALPTVLQRDYEAVVFQRTGVVRICFERQAGRGRRRCRRST